MPFLSRAQAEQPFRTGCDTELHLLMKDSLGSYWACDRRAYYEGKDGFRLFDTSGQLLEEGARLLHICSQLSYREGKWSFYYPNGKLESTGVIDRRRLSGIWRYYYDNGRLKESVTYDTIYCGLKNGLYESFTRDGKLIESGYYCLCPDTNAMDTTFLFDPVTEIETATIQKATTPKSIQCGEWKGYDAQGVLIRRKLFPAPAKQESHPRK